MKALYITSRSQWEDALIQLEDWFSLHKIDVDIQQKILIAFDEVISNIFNHNQQETPIEIYVHISKKNSIISVSFKDNCKLFNPLNNPEKKIVTFGGWGVDIIKKLMDVVEYDIVDTKNCLTLKKHVL